MAKSAGKSLGIPADFPENFKSAGKSLDIPADLFLHENPQEKSKFLVVLYSKKRVGFDGLNRVRNDVPV
jgi:hypothetical protein